jgi:hypothetical protein
LNDVLDFIHVWILLALKDSIRGTGPGYRVMPGLTIYGGMVGLLYTISFRFAQVPTSIHNSAFLYHPRLKAAALIA